MAIAKLQLIAGSLVIGGSLALTILGWSRGPEAETPFDTPMLTAAPIPQEKLTWRQTSVWHHDHPVNVVACSTEWIAVGDEGGNLVLYDAKTGLNRKIIRPGGKQEQATTFKRLQFTPDRKYLWAVMGKRQGIVRYDLHKLNGPQPILGSDLGVSAEGGWWLESLGTRTLTIRPNLYDLKKPEDFERDYEGYAQFEAVVLDAVLSPDDKWVAVVTDDERISIHDRASLNRDFAKRPAAIPVLKQPVSALQFSKDGKRLAIVGPNGFAKIYDPATGKEVISLKGHRGTIHSVAFSPDNQRLVTGGADLVARVWDVATGKLISEIEGFEEAIRSVAFDPSGETLVVGSADKTTKVYRLSK